LVLLLAEVIKNLVGLRQVNGTIIEGKWPTINSQITATTLIALQSSPVWLRGIRIIREIGWLSKTEKEHMAKRADVSLALFP